jgi:hypothetical protein
MFAGRLDIPIIVANGDFSLVLNCVSPPANSLPASALNLGAPFDLTSYTSALLQIRNGQSQSSPLVFAFSSSPSAGQGTITLGGASGTITLLAAQSLLSALVSGEYSYDLILSNATVNLRFLYGSCMVDNGITVAPAPYFPSTYNPLFYLDASMGVGVADGAAVPTWTDVLGNPFTQAVGADQFTYHAAGLNGHPCLQSDGTDDFMVSSNNYPIGNAYTFTALLQFTGFASSSPLIFGNTQSGNNGASLTINTAGSLDQVTTTTAGSGICSSSVAENISSQVYLICTRNGSGTDLIYRNGVSVGGTPAGLTVTSANLPVYVGQGAPSGGTGFLAAKIRQLGLFNYAFSPAQITAWNAYFASIL